MTTLTPADPATARDVANRIADALTNPAITQPRSIGRRYRPQSLAGGAVGIALLHAERAHAGLGDQATARSWLRAAIAEPLSCGPNANLFHGAPALGYLLHTATAGTSRSLPVIDEHVTALTRGRLAAAQARIDRGQPLVMREFDLVHGLTGLGVYHLLRHPSEPITAEVLTYLARLTQPLPDRGDDGLPPWWLASGLTGEPEPAYPRGHGNLGVAHGLSAVIALLSLAVLDDMPVPHMREAIQCLCEWTDRCRQDDAQGPWWPGYITPDSYHGTDPLKPRPGWCYGIAGTARAQQLAGLAFHQPDRSRYAETAMLAALQHPDLPAHLPQIGLCHGKAGLLQAASRMAADSSDTRLATALPNVVASLCTQLAARLEQCDPELLDGTAGAALALQSAGNRGPATRWDAFLLLA